MNFRIAALCGALSFVLAACPPGTDGEDGGVLPDAGDNIPVGGCTAPCGPNQVCDPVQRKCVPGCSPGCTQGQICVKNGENFECVEASTSCSGTVCGEGQNVCLFGNCSCLPPPHAQRDTCSPTGRTCDGLYNPVTMTGGSCVDPRAFEQCLPTCPDGEDCGVCPAGFACDTALFAEGMCMRTCDELGQGCGPAELCASTGFCYPKAVFGAPEGGNFACFQVEPDGGTLRRVNASEPCFLSDNNGRPVEPTPSGTCSWVRFRTAEGTVTVSNCRPPGPVPEFGTCTLEPWPVDISQTCAAGLECAPVTGSTTEGICMRICNARPELTGVGETGCGTDEACINLYRVDNEASEVGVCVKTCNVFDPASTCAPAGTVPTSCVPTSATGVQFVTGAGQGLCIPQQETVVGEGEPCATTDAFQGAACASDLICTEVAGQPTPICVKPCDVACADSGDGGVPSRCATEKNATCGAGKTCTRVTGTTGAFLGYCL